MDIRDHKRARDQKKKNRTPKTGKGDRRKERKRPKKAKKRLNKDQGDRKKR